MMQMTLKQTGERKKSDLRYSQPLEPKFASIPMFELYTFLMF